MGLESVELVLAIEEEFGLRFPNEDAAKLVTVGDISSYVQSRLERQHARQLSEAEAAAVWERIKQIVVEQLGVDPAAVTPTASLVEDLGID